MHTDIRSDGAVDRYVYFPGSFLVLAVLDENNAPKELYTRGPDLSGTLSGAGGIGGILACTYATGPVLYHHADLMGNIIALTDPSGSVASTFRYTPFGQLSARTGPLLPRHLFSSKEFVEEIQLVYYGHRYYCPRLGKWWTRDKLQEKSDANLNRFVRNNMLLWIDPIGLSTSPEGCRISYFYEREDPDGFAATYLENIRNEILDAYPCATVQIANSSRINGRDIRNARLSSDLIVIVGHGTRCLTKEATTNLAKRINPSNPTDYTTQLSNVTHPDSWNETITRLEDIFPEQLNDNNSTLDCVILGTCNNGYAPTELFGGTPVVRIQPNVHDPRPWEGEAAYRPDWDSPDEGGDGGTRTITHLAGSKTEIMNFLKANCCCRR